MRARQSVAGLLAFVAIMAVTGIAYAACGISDRVTHGNAACLHAWWDNNPWPQKSKFGAQNQCAEWGRVVAKIDIYAASDRTWHLNNGSKRRGSASNRVRDVHCCKDLSVLCSYTDVITIEGCTSQWDKSPASDTCELAGGTTYSAGSTTPNHITASDRHCHINALCEYTAEDGSTQTNQTSISYVFWPDTDEVQNCDGELKEKGSC